LRELSETTREGSNLYTLSESAEKIGFRTLGVKLSLQKLLEAPLPCILHWNKNHYVVLYSVKIKKSTEIFYISDPALGLLKYTKTEFLKFWIGNNTNETTEEGVALLLETTPKFYNQDSLFTSKEEKSLGLDYLTKHIYKYKSFIIQLILGLFVGSIIQLIFPFLTQSIVDMGIKNQNLNFVSLILFSQLFLFFGKTALDFIRNWTLLHLSTRINISLLSDFFIKLMNLPISFFDVRFKGDIIQRINDHSRIERILTVSSLNVLFSIINLIIMGGILAYYNVNIFVIFSAGNFLYFCWIMIFLKKKEKNWIIKNLPL